MGDTFLINFRLLPILSLCALFLMPSSAPAQMVTGMQENFSGMYAQPQAIPLAPIPNFSGRRGDRDMRLDPYQDITLQVGNQPPRLFRRATVQSLSQAFIKLTGVDLNDDKLIDDFTIINHCNLYKQYFNDEFAWRQAREAFRRVIQRELESYPENIYLLGSISLGRYDFDRKAFILEEENKFDNTGVFRFSDRNFDCDGAVVNQLPLTYHIRLTNPITLDQIDIPEDKAFTITRILEQEKNLNRKVYLTFFMRLNDFSTQGGGTNNTTLRAITRATLQSMRIYIDRQRKILIYEYTGDRN